MMEISNDLKGWQTFMEAVHLTPKFHVSVLFDCNLIKQKS